MTFCKAKMARSLSKNKEKMFYDLSCCTPASNFGYLAPPPGQFFIGAKLFIGTPWMGNEGVLKKILVWAM